MSRREAVKKYNNKVEVKLSKHQWYLDHKELTIERAKEWSKNNLDKRRKIGREYSYRKHFGGNRPVLINYCELCEKNTNLIVHHRDGNNGRKGKPTNNSKDNLIILCRSCHTKVHHPRKELVLV